eukprot:2489528-Pyramimonas_sp.AAC.1
MHVTRAVGELESSYKRQSIRIRGVRLLHPRGSSTSPPAVSKVDGLPPAPSWPARRKERMWQPR